MIKIIYTIHSNIQANTVVFTNLYVYLRLSRVKSDNKAIPVRNF